MMNQIQGSAVGPMGDLGDQVYHGCRLVGPIIHVFAKVEAQCSSVGRTMWNSELCLANMVSTLIVLLIYNLPLIYSLHQHQKSIEYLCPLLLWTNTCLLSYSF